MAGSGGDPTGRSAAAGADGAGGGTASGEQPDAPRGSGHDRRAIFEKALYPAVDPLASKSRILDPRVVGRELYETARGVQQFLSQNLHAAEVYTNQPGTYVPVHETVRGFREILEGNHDELPESAFCGVGTIDEAVAKADELLAVAA